MSEDHCSQNGGHVGTKEVCAHTCHITHIVAYIVCDGRWIAWIVLRNTRFDLPHQISPDIGGFRIDTTAHTSKEGDGLCTQRKSGQNFQSLAHLIFTVHTGEYDEQQTKAKNSESSYAQTHH
ncbi:MAG: Uncharacterised protein [Flavobacteriia bacterium]|nr:MAG: Uncharacterised protein [Flavobacteriia bacterium]